MTPTEVTTLLRQFNGWRRDFEDKFEQPDPHEVSEAIDAAIEMIDRLEAAEKSDAESIAMYRRARDERDTLRAKIEAMERQEPFDAEGDVFRSAFEAALKAGNWPMTRQGDGYRSPFTQIAWRVAFSTVNRLNLYLAPGAQPAPIEQDTSVRKAWARFSNELHRSPDAPYPGMSEAFERHFSQSFTDREWRAESATWAAAWKAAKRHEAQAQPAPSVPEGWKLVPIEPTPEGK